MYEALRYRLELRASREQLLSIARDYRQPFCLACASRRGPLGDAGFAGVAKNLTRACVAGLRVLKGLPSRKLSSIAEETVGVLRARAASSACRQVLREAGKHG